MITRVEFQARCKAEGYTSYYYYAGRMGFFWRVPIKVLLWWNYATNEVHLVENAPEALARPDDLYVVKFSDLDAVIATFNLMNP